MHRSTGAASLAFVDSALPDFQTLADALRSLSEGGAAAPDVVVLDSGQSGLRQITDALAGRTDLAAVYIFSHGFGGNLSIGSTRLDVAGLVSHADELASWSRSLQPGADLLLYGCDVGEGQRGGDLVTRLAALTGADVAASTDATGSESLGANWRLERTAGRIEAALPASMLNGYRHLLAAVGWDGGGDGVSWSDALNWSGDVLPGASDDVTITGTAGDPPIKIDASAGVVSIRSLNSGQAITLSTGARLQAATTIDLSQDLTLSGGTILGGTVTGSAKLIGTSTGGTLDGVT
ncbi:MAG: DUF4347 domain-containing protein, partial [Caldimonas sp.]